MKRILLLIALISANIAAFAQPEAPYVPGELLVQVTDNEEIDKLVESLATVSGVTTGLEKIEVLSKHMRIWKLGYDNENISARDMRSALWKHNLVQIVQYNHYVTLRETPNDPNYGNQWHHNDPQDNDIDSEEAWDVTTGGTTAFGDEIVVCVIEGGNLNHADLQENKWFNEAEIPDNGIDDDGNGYIDDYDGWNVASNDDSGVFNGGHGTQVMGMIGAKGNNDLGVSGINWDVKIMSVAGENLGNEASVIEAYDYPLQMRKLYNETGGAQGAFVVATNASWGIDFGNPNDIPLWCNFYDSLGTYGILNCGATSNQNINIDEVGDIPTACSSDYMISVTATNSSDQRTFSAYGATTVDLGAPGESVYTTQGSDSYGNTSGTSFASPLTAGSIALIYSTPCPSFMSLVMGDPQAGADYVREVLFEGTDPVPNLDGDCVTGGRLNVNNSIQLILNSCSDSECLVPFGLAVENTAAEEYTVSWGGLESMLSFDLRYREVGMMDWTEVNGLTDESYVLTGLPWCTEYEVQISANCDEDEESDWSQSVTFETDGCCENPAFESIVVTGISETGATISCDAVLAAETYNFLITPTDGGDAIELESATNSVDVTGLSPCTFYEVQVAIDCADDELDYTADVSFNTTGCGACADLAFCDSFGGADEEWIERVELEDINNLSGSNGGYGDYTNVPDVTTTLDPGGTYEISLTPGYDGFAYGEYFVVWIDLNQDGQFTDNEIVFDAGEAVDTEVTADINVPVSAAAGSSRMRVSMKYLGFANPEAHGPCEEMEYGEVEDYCVEISDNIISVEENGQVNWSLFPNPARDVLNVSVPKGTYQLEMLDLTGRIVYSNTINGQQQVNTSQYPAGVYVARLSSEGKVVAAERVILK